MRPEPTEQRNRRWREVYRNGCWYHQQEQRGLSPNANPDTVLTTGSTSTKECGYSFIASPSSSRDHWGNSPFTWEYDTVFMMDSGHRSSAFSLKLLIASLSFTEPS